MIHTICRCFVFRSLRARSREAERKMFFSSLPSGNYVMSCLASHGLFSTVQYLVQDQYGTQLQQLSIHNKWMKLIFLFFFSLPIFPITECTSSTENWMCLNCGQVLCGRYVNGHALHHSNANRQHYVCLNTLDCSVFCYKCDDFVINDTAKNLLYNLRQELKDDDTSSEASSSLDELLSSSSYQESGSSTSSSDSGWFEETANGSKGGRTLRPRKRTISNDVSGGSGNNNKSTSSSSSGEPTNKKPLRKIVGLRNLGNTCFINSVVQSLSNIRDFSCFFNSLPSLETKPSPQQQLQPTPPKRVYYSRSYKENESSMNEANVAEELRKILSDLNHGGDGSKAVSPECFILVIWKVVPQFRGHRQHDAHEFLRYMLDRLHTELQCLTAPLDVVNATHAKLNGKLLNGIGNGEANNITFRGKSSIVTNVFGGTLQSEVRYQCDALFFFFWTFEWNRLLSLVR